MVCPGLAIGKGWTYGDGPETLRTNLYSLLPLTVGAVGVHPRLCFFPAALIQSRSLQLFHVRVTVTCNMMVLRPTAVFSITITDLASAGDCYPRVCRTYGFQHGVLTHQRKSDMEQHWWIRSRFEPSHTSYACDCQQATGDEYREAAGSEQADGQGISCAPQLHHISYATIIPEGWVHFGISSHAGFLSSTRGPLGYMGASKTLATSK